MINRGMIDRSEVVTMRKIAGLPFLRSIDRRNGFTLVEIMIALFILVVGILGVISVATTIINGNAFGKRITTATTLAQDKIEELKVDGYSGITSGSDTQESIYTRTWTVTDASPVAGMKTIQVDVAFQWNNATRTVTLKTIMAEW